MWEREWGVGLVFVYKVKYGECRKWGYSLFLLGGIRKGFSVGVWFGFWRRSKIGR